VTDYFALLEERYTASEGSWTVDEFGVAGLVLSIGLLFFLLSTMARIVQEGLNR
jgi:hypothetical protein